ncbi:TonB-dependent receptor [Neptunicella marina]|uniref:TonB-dependent siderophore receptor n=1 Tax=Neptunicella marina TaxID=2125989 RepID=A0A8J6IQR2_9ALTE|nr:TonB-dependent siderophore receptor [Neptunicella marina]MBC3764779.1 TonB-dependent siderophore receptor [Neptunicella marina]
MGRTNHLVRLNGFHQTALAVAITASLPTLASAQEVKQLPMAQAQAQTEQDYKVDQSTSYKNPLPLVDTAKTIDIVPQSVMKDRNVDNLRDALRNVPGISLAAGEGGAPPGDSMTIRGFDATNAIFIDGIRDLAGYSRDTFNTEAVEVSKGAGSTIAGRGTGGGSINMQTKTAKLDDFADVSARIGSESDYRATLDYNTKMSNSSALRINILSDDGDVAGRDNVSNGTDGIAVSYMSQLSEKTTLAFNADMLKQDNTPDYGIPWVSAGLTEGPLKDYAGGPPPVDFDNFYGNLYRDFEDIDAKSFTLKFEHQLSNQTSLRVVARSASVDRENVVTAPRFINVSESTDIRMSDEKTRDTSNSINIIQADLTGRYQTGSVTHNVVAGVELAKEKFERWGYVALIADNLNDDPGLNDLYNPDPYLEFTGQYGRDGTKTYADGDSKAIYALDNIELNQQWLIGLGVRWDDFETKYHNDDEDLSSFIGISSSKVSWNANLSYKPAENGTIYLSTSTAFTPVSTNLTGGSRGNQNELDPEKNESIELGTKWELLNQDVLVSAAIFRNVKTNGYVRSPEDRNLYSMDGEQKVEGLELGVTGRITDAFSITAGYAYQDSEVTAGAEAELGFPLARAPKNSASLWGRYDLSKQISAGLGVEYVGERYNGTSDTRRKANSYTLLDMMVSYQVNEKFAVRLNGSNLTDKDYIDQLGGGHFIPGVGRHISLSATYSF